MRFFSSLRLWFILARRLFSIKGFEDFEDSKENVWLKSSQSQSLFHQNLKHNYFRSLRKLSGFTFRLSSLPEFPGGLSRPIFLVNAFLCASFQTFAEFNLSTTLTQAFPTQMLLCCDLYDRGKIFRDILLIQKFSPRANENVCTIRCKSVVNKLLLTERENGPRWLA